MFSKKTRHDSDTKTHPEYIQVRSMYGVSFHIRRGDEPRGDALCGYSNWVETNSVMGVTAEEVRETLDQQHAGWRWCSLCASSMTGIASDLIRQRGISVSS